MQAEALPLPRRRAFSTVFLTVLLDLIGFSMILPLLPFYALEFGASHAQIGFLYASYSLAQLVCAPLLGRLSDRVGRRPVLLVSIAGGVGAYLLFAAAGSYAVLLIARLFAGMAAGNYGIAQAYVADVTPADQRARAMGMVGAAFGLAFVLGPTLGGFLAPLGPAVVPLTAAGLGTVNLLFALLWLPESLSPELRGEVRERPWLSMAGLRRLSGDRPLLGLMLLLFLVLFCFSFMESTLPLYCHERFDFEMAETSWLFAFIGVVLVVVQGGLLGRLVRRFGERRLVVAGMLSMMVGLVLLPLTPAAWLLAGAAAFLAVGAGLHNPSLLSLLSRLTDERSQGGTIGLARSFSALARTLGPPAGTWIFGAYGPAWPFWTAAMLMGGALLFAWALLRRIQVG